VPAALAAQEALRTISLAEALELALRNAPAMVAAEGALDVAEAGLLQARGALLPSLTANGVFSNSSNERFDQTTGRLVSQNYTAQLQAGYDIFTGGRRLARLRGAGAEVSAAEAQMRAQRFETVLATTQAFYAAAAANDIVRAAEQRLERARQQMDFAETRLEIGTVTQSDALRAELEVGNAEVAVIDAQSALRNSTLLLGRRIGVAQAVRADPAALPVDAPPLPPIDELIARALRMSPDVLAAEATLESRTADRLESYLAYSPTVRITGGYDWFSFDFPPEEQSWNFRIIASLPVFNNFGREAAVERASAARRTAQAQARDAALAVRAAVEAAASEVGSAERRVNISDRAVELAREDLRVQEERYQIGAATILDLQTSQVALTDAEVAAVRARQALGTAIAQLEAVLGQTITEAR
jgi:outer membrane protein TolC